MGPPNAVTASHYGEPVTGDVYGYWRDVENLPTFMHHLEQVVATGNGHSRWTAKAPAGRTVSRETELTTDRTGEQTAWQSLPGADVPNSGSVRFRAAPGDRGTEVRVRLRRAQRQVPDGLGDEPVADHQAGQCPVHRYMRPLLVRIRNGEIDPSFVITYRMGLSKAPHGYDIFKGKQDDCHKVVLTP